MATENLTPSEYVQLNIEFGQKAKDMLIPLGISFLPGSFNDICRITSRDTEGELYPYNAGFSSSEKIRKNWIIVKDDVEIGFYYTGLEKDEKRGKKIGEVGMINLAPAIRNKGLFTLIKLLGSMQLLQEGAEVLRSVIGDKTGKVEGVNQKLGFVKTEKTSGELLDPVWEMDASNSQEKLRFFMQEFEKRLQQIKKEDLSFAPETIDIDNPQRIPIKDTVLKRLEEKAWDFKEEERILFGYPLAPILIFQEHTKLVLRVNKTTDKTSSIAYFEIVIPNLKTEKEAQEAAQKISEIGQMFFGKTNTETEFVR